MRRGLILLILSLLFVSRAAAFELVIPKDKNNITTSNYAFFVGKAKGAEALTINGQSIYVAPNGAFAHTVKLHDGENRIVFRTAYGVQIYKYLKNTIKEQPIPTEEFEPVKAYVNSDNTPLRNTPVDAGLNRISHLFSGTEVLINGSKGSFYRVFLSKNNEAWIAKNDVTLSDDKLAPAEFINMDSERFKNAIIQTISFDKNLPYSIENAEKEIIFRVYNPELSEDSVYSLNIPKPEKYTYTVHLENGKYTFKVSKLPENIKDIIVAIDAGHGGSERGAIGCLGDEEKTITLKIAQQVAKILENKGVKVVMTREVDANVSLNDRINLAKDSDANLFVSIHLNSIPDIPMNIHKNRGTSVYYFNDNAKKFAEVMKKSVTNHAGTRDDGVLTASFAVIRPTEYTGIIVETAYMTNPMDSVLYTNDKWISKAAKGIAEGIIEYVSK